MTWNGLAGVAYWTIDYERDELIFAAEDGRAFRKRGGARRGDGPLDFKRVTVAASSLAAMELVIPDPQTLLQEAVMETRALVESLDTLVLPTDTVTRLLEEAKAQAQQLINDPPPLPQTNVDLYVAAVRSAEEMIYGTADSVTQMELLLQDEITPPTAQVEGELVRVLNASINESYAGLPDNWKPTFDALWDSLVNAQALAETAKLTVMGVGNAVDHAIGAVDSVEAQQEQNAHQSSGETAPVGDEKGCEVDYIDGVHVYYGNEKGNDCTGTAGVDIFHMRGGSDTAFGRGSSDQIHLAWGYDTGYGEDGPDYIWGGTENDALVGQYGDDTLRDTQDTSLDGDDLYGGPGSDFGDILDGDIADSFFGGKGEDKEPKYDKAAACGGAKNCATGSDEIDMGN